jgi:hypothetical protein
VPWAAMTSPSIQYKTILREVRIVGSDQATGFGIMDGLGRTKYMRMQNTRIFLVSGVEV